MSPRHAVTSPCSFSARQRAVGALDRHETLRHNVTHYSSTRAVGEAHRWCCSVIGGRRSNHNIGGTRLRHHRHRACGVWCRHRRPHHVAPYLPLTPSPSAPWYSAWRDGPTHSFNTALGWLLPAIQPPPRSSGKAKTECGEQHENRDHRLRVRRGLGHRGGDA